MEEEGRGRERERERERRVAWSLITSWDCHIHIYIYKYIYPCAVIDGERRLYKEAVLKKKVTIQLLRGHNARKTPSEQQ